MKKCLIAIVVTMFIFLNAFGQIEIQSSGDVGIGTSTPTTKLDVNGDLRVRTLNQNNSADSVVVVTGNGTLEYRSAATLGSGGGTCSYAIGDTAFGGLIFYLDGTGCHGLVADTVDMGGSGTVHQWANSNVYTSAFADWAGGGKVNTDRIIAVYGAAVNAPAANECQNSTAQGFTDWYLPNKTELNMMFMNLHLQGLGSFNLCTYWSSVEASTSLASFLDFFDGSVDTGNKTLNIDVRAIRAF